MSYNCLDIQQDEKVALVYLKRPKALNALNHDLLSDLASYLQNNIHNSDIRAIVFTGYGDKAFVAGADIKEFANYDSKQGEALSRKWQNEVFDVIENYPKPIIAAINGFALGGGLELAISCHIRLASEQAKMGLPEVSLGLVPGYGGTQRLAGLVGKGWANQITLSAQMVTSSKAVEIGLINEVFSADNLIDESIQLAKRICNNAPNAISSAIELINQHKNPGGFEKEKVAFGKLFDHQNFKEGTQAFLDKRKPSFK